MIFPILITQSNRPKGQFVPYPETDLANDNEA